MSNYKKYFQSPDFYTPNILPAVYKPWGTPSTFTYPGQFRQDINYFQYYPYWQKNKQTLYPGLVGFSNFDIWPVYTEYKRW